MHDPIKFLTELRDHLARHDKPLVFLFGAGTSCAVNAAPLGPDGKPKGYRPLIPAIIPLTSDCKAAAIKLDRTYEKPWDLIVAECAVTRANPNIEDILSRVRGKASVLGTRDTLCGLNVSQFQNLEKSISNTIFSAVNIDEAGIPAHVPHDDFAAWIRRRRSLLPIEIFTPNYDLLIERSLERAFMPVFDGFVGSYRPFFQADYVERDSLMPEWIRVWKMHGSINWQTVKENAGLRIYRSRAPDSSHLILPSYLKYDESRKQPYIAMLARLSRVLEREDSLLITCGYSFSDEHINAALLTALEKRHRSHLIALSYSDLDANSDVIRFASRRPNVIVAGPTSAMIGGALVPWLEKPAIPADLAATISVAYAPAILDAAGTVSTPARVLLGDFNSFGAFLLSMVD